MKRTFNFKWVLSFLFICLSSNAVFAQTVKDILKWETPITYLGIDFTLARLIGDDGADEVDVKQKFAAINSVVINEPKKYNLKKAFHKDSVAVDLALVTARNEKIDEHKIKSAASLDADRFNKTAIEDLIKHYKFNKDGIGVMFIMEALNKTEKRAYMHVVFVDMANNKVILTDRMYGKSGGFGFRNYWARPVYEVLGYIEDSRYKSWKNSNL
jgi:hypothetical protein